jgi:hypothetical protein
MVKSISMALLMSWCVACSNAAFDGDGNASGRQPTGAQDSSQPGPGLNANQSQPDPRPGEETGDESDQAAIRACLAKFQSHPFGQPQQYHFRKISASVQVLGAGNPIVDNVATAEPSLVLIGAAVNVLGQSTYQLLNPNAYYCLKVDVNVLSSLNIQLHCKAKLADNKVNVSVLSNAQATGKVGVHVGSNVAVTPVGC